jgi:hypothetical protein
MYVYYQTKFPNLVFAKETLKNYLHDNLKELKAINSNEERFERATL